MKHDILKRILLAGLASLALSGAALADAHGGTSGSHGAVSHGYGGHGHALYGGGGHYAGGYAPRGGYSVNYNGGRYYYRGGAWYGWRGGAWGLVGAPFGAWLPFLPLYYSVFWWDGWPYYYADHVYYRASDTGNGYTVVAPPPGAPGENAQASLFAYPNNGQSAEAQAKDRYECHRWAADQTGFDPTQPGGGVAATDNAARRADYQRAESACLEARGYTVK
jgi:hypothetical protein